MLIRATAIGFSVLALASAHAEDAAKKPRLAALDVSGRVLPLDAPTTSIDRIEGNATAKSCADAKALSPDAARALVARIATEENFFPDLVQSVAKIESHFNSIALSDKGAFGLMQLLPETARRFQVDLCDPAGNVRGGVRFLRLLHDKYRNPFFLLAAYNAGEAAVEKNRGVPPFPETVRFVAQVINDFYTWPTPGPLAHRGSRGGNEATGDLIELVAPGAAASAPIAQPATQARWNDGFVMHVN